MNLSKRGWRFQQGRLQQVPNSQLSCLVDSKTRFEAEQGDPVPRCILSRMRDEFGPPNSSPTSSAVKAT